jgi:hypothetical protein
MKAEALNALLARAFPCATPPEALADTAAYGLVQSAIGLQPTAVTTNLSINFLRPAGPNSLAAEARMLKLGHTLAVCDVLISAESAEHPCAHVWANSDPIRLDRNARTLSKRVFRRPTGIHLVGKHAWANSDPMKSDRNARTLSKRVFRRPTGIHLVGKHAWANSDPMKSDRNARTLSKRVFRRPTGIHLVGKHASVTYALPPKEKAQ